MDIPNGMTEAEVIQIIEKVVHRLAYKFKFGYHDIDDMKQQGRLEAIKALDSGKYDNSRPLENFLWTHVHNRLFNFKRDNYARPDTPCDDCSHTNDSGCTKYITVDDCPLHRNWLMRNFTKRNLMQPLAMSKVDDEHEISMKAQDDIVGSLIHQEIVDLIETHLPIVLRRDWLLCKKSVKISKPRRNKLQEAIITILEGAGIDVEEAWKITH